MAWDELFWQGLFWGAGLGMGSVFFGYPLLLFLAVLFTGQRRDEKRASPSDLPQVSMLVVFRNAGDLLKDKIENFSILDYPKEKLELVLISDGSQDPSKELAMKAQGERIQFRHLDMHLGKAICMNTGISMCRGEIVLFSDADAMLAPDAIQMLVRHFTIPRVGGVCGQRVVSEKTGAMETGQERFIQWDSMIKILERRLGISVTSHDGKLYAIRRELFSPVPQGVTDDAYVSLSVVRQGFDFRFDPGARARIPLPSRNAGHELRRRKRIVSTSLRGLWYNRSLFNPRRYGIFAAGLFINKVVRRLIPFFLMGALISSLALCASPFYGIAAGIQALGYGLALAYPAMGCLSKVGWARVLNKLAGLCHFFCVGMAGTLWGVVSFLTGETITKWEPEKK